MQAQKYYVVWQGFSPGVYDSWEEAELQVKGYPNASYRAYRDETEAVKAFREGFDKVGLLQEVAREVARLNQEGVAPREGKPVAAAAPSSDATPRPTPKRSPRQQPAQPQPAPVADARPKPYDVNAIAVDAACSGNPGPMEYRGVYLRTGQQLFKVGPMEGGTNNIGEFLAIVHALALQAKQGTRLIIYSDSRNAQLWVRQGLCKTKLEMTERNRPIFDLIRRAEEWLRTHRIDVPILKWDTKRWGEIPADFGRK